MVKVLNNLKCNNRRVWTTSLACLSVAMIIFSNEAVALTVGGMSSEITSSFTSLTKLITAGSYLAGLGFSIGAIIKFKQHKDNPQSTPIGNPIALVFIAAALLFLPTILGIAGSTMFGAGGGTVAGPSGAVYKTS